ncbi:MAG: S49 family peptidase [Salinibacter sp.]
MRRLFFLLVFAGLAVFAGGAQPAAAQAPDMASYYETTDFLGAPPASFREGLLGYGNPAVPALAGNHLVAAWSTDGRDAASVQDWGVFTSVGGLGAGLVRRTAGPLQTTGYHLSLSGGMDGAAVGLGYQGFSGDATALGRYNRLRVGTVARPSPYLSIGLAGAMALETDDREIVGEVGLRPFGSPTVTLFADAAWGEGEALADVPWSAGAAVEVVDGVDLRTRVFDSEALSVGLRVELGRAGVDSQSRIDPSGDYAGQVTRVRVGDYEPSALVETMREGEEHVERSLRGPVTYRETRLGDLFGDAPPRFYELLRTIRQAGESDRVAALALDLSGIQVRPELAWELRTAVQRAQARGVTVIAHLKSGGMTAYHLASVADVVALDPQGSLTLPGYAASRTFVKGTLEKLGLGVQAWRFFEYKSAFERFSRTDFSEADSLQRQQYVNDQYELTTEDITAARPLGADSLDRIIDETLLLTAREARRVGLVDTLARWRERDGLLRAATGAETAALDADNLDQIATATRGWGSPAEIALVYGLGATQVEGGMGSRALSTKIRALAEDDDVAAVVFRVDSPGGSPVAAAQVAEALRACARQKPVIVSQGQVAGSGGYWVSTHADTIVAGPNTVTGSIGVIGGWIYDKRFGDKTGLSSDVVQRGARADLLQGLQLPLLGVSIPTRKLTDEELARIETVIRAGYDEFVAAVAEGRDTTEAHIREVGAGRIYSGRDGKAVGLVDEVGGLSRAVALAREAAGLEADEGTVREVNPTSGTVDLGRVLPGPLGVLAEGLGRGAAVRPGTRTAPTRTALRLLLKHQPGPLVLLPPGAVPTAK